MNIVKIDLHNGLARIDSTLIEVTGDNVLVPSVAKLCSPPTLMDGGHTRYRMLRKVIVFGKSADCVIETGEAQIICITFLFDLIEFFNLSILESTILKACEKSLDVHFTSNHPATAFLECCECGDAIFSYDAKQGDLSFQITLRKSKSYKSD